MNRALLPVKVQTCGFGEVAPVILERLATLRAYWKLDDTLCRTFLSLGRDARDFEAVKYFFPLIRELTVCEIPREWRHLGDALYFAFHAGHDLGVKQPDLKELLLPGRETLRGFERLEALHGWSGHHQLNKHNLHPTFGKVASAYRIDAKSTNPTVLACGLMLATARAGYLAGALGQSDPTMNEIFTDAGQLVGDSFPSPFLRALVAAPWRVAEEGITSMPPHPLLRVARELYPDNTLEGRTVLAFLEQHLLRTGVAVESDCPGSELDLLDWVAAGLKYGRRTKAQKPERVAAIFKECEGNRLEESRRVINRVIKEAKGTTPLALIRPLLAWYARTHSDQEPHFHGQRLARVAALADFAVWIPWVMERNRHLKG